MKIILVFFLLFSTLFADEEVVENIDKIQELKAELEILDEELMQNSLNIKYGNYFSYHRVIDELSQIDIELAKKISSDKRAELLAARSVLLEKKEILKNYQDFSLSKLLIIPDEIERFPRLSNPLAIFAALSQIKKLENESSSYEQELIALNLLREKVEKKISILTQLFLMQSTAELKIQLELSTKELSDFTSLSEHALNALNLHKKKSQEEISRINSEIKAQAGKIAGILLTIALIIALSFILKLVVKKYAHKTDRIYTLNKLINISHFLLIIFILMFAYIENISYLVTVLGFASAGIAFAMKDMFMSILGWFVIIFGTPFSVGDRIKVRRDNYNYIGDIIDISLLRITISEDVTLTTYTTNRRSGRVIFIPNNYIFTDCIFNYTHQGFKTIWDGIDILFSFDSNIEKAREVMEEAVNKHSGASTEFAKRAVLKMRQNYNLKAMKVEPRIFTFIEPNGVKISAWYMVSAREALRYRSLICMDILEALKECEDIKIAYDTHTIYHDKRANQPFNSELE